MRTAMQELIDFLDKSINGNDPFYDPIKSEVFKALYKGVKIGATQLLEKEKQQIIDAWDDGLHKGYTSDQGSAIQYYNETFKNEKQKAL